MSSEYWERIAKRVRTFAEPGDPLQCVEVRRSSTPETCELCGHSPIFWLHYLKNLRTGEQLIVGSQCILNYKRVYEKFTGNILQIQVEERLSWWADKMNSKSPDAVTIIPTDYKEVYHGEYLVGEESRDWSEEYDIEDEDFDEELEEEDLNDLAPEGLGADEIDWDSL